MPPTTTINWATVALVVIASVVVLAFLFGWNVNF